MFLSAFNHVLLKALVVVISLLASLVRTEPHKIGVAHHLECSLGHVGRTGLQTGHVGVGI